MIRPVLAAISRFAVPLALAAATGLAGAQTINYGNSPGGYPGNVNYAGGATTLQTGTPVDLVDWHFGDSVDFSFQTGATADGWTFAAGGTVTMTVGYGFGGGIDLDNDFNPDILPGTVLFSGILGTTTVRDRSAIECNPTCIGSPFDISASFTTSNLHSAYAATLGLPTGSYTGSFLFGIDSWNGGAIPRQGIGWREVHITLDAQSPAPIPEPETYAMLLAGLGLLGFVARRRKQAAA